MVQIDKPGITLKGVLYTLGVWFIYTVLNAGLLSGSSDLPYVYAIIGTGMSSGIKLIFLVSVWFGIYRTLYMTDMRVRISVIALSGIPYVILWYVSYVFVFNALIGTGTLDQNFAENRGWILFTTYLEFAIVFSIIHLIDYRQALRVNEQAAAELQKLTQQQEIATLKAQINPHFLFNTLNGINAMISKDADKSRQMIAQLSEMLRYSLDSFDREIVELEHEIEFIRTYLSLEKMRLGERLHTEVNVQADTQISIPPMLIQPLVENAVKHGISPLEEGGFVRIDLKQKNDQLEVTIEDNGTGIAETEIEKLASGIGLRNTNRILQTKYGDSAGLQITKITPHGTCIRFTIPAGE